MVLLLFSLLAVILINAFSLDEGGSNDDLVLLWRLSGCSEGAVNDIYHCAHESLCVSSTAQYRLVRTSVWLNNSVQNVWYVGQYNLTSSSPQSKSWLYGALELSKSPIVLKTWKKFLPNLPIQEETEMTLTEVPLQCSIPSDPLPQYILLRGLLYLHELSSQNKAKAIYHMTECIHLTTNEQAADLIRYDLGRLRGKDYNQYDILSSLSLLHKFPTLFAHLLLQLLIEKQDMNLLYVITSSLSHINPGSENVPEINSALLSTALLCNTLVTGQYHAITITQRIPNEAIISINTSPGTSIQLNYNDLKKSLVMLKVFYTNTLVYNNPLLEFIIYFLQQTDSIISRNTAQFDRNTMSLLHLEADAGFSSYIIHSLVGMGANYLASIHFFYLTYNLRDSNIDSSANPISHENDTAISLNIKAVDILFVHIERFGEHIVGDDDLLPLLFFVLSEVLHPVILDTSAWEAEVLHLRSTGYSILLMIDSICKRKHCAWSVATVGSFARGLFLQAYQGLALISSAERFMKDMAVSQMYLDMTHSSVVEQMPSTIYSFGTERKRKGKLRLLFAGYSFYRHSVGRLLSTIICSIAEDERIEVYILSDLVYTGSMREDEKADDISLSLMQCVGKERWITLPPHQYGQVFTRTINLIFSLSFHVTVYSDLSLQSSLFAWATVQRLSPIQILFWGHPFTTSASAIDYFISSDLFEPTSMEKREKRSAQFSEQIVSFDTLSFMLALPEPQAQDKEKASTYNDSTAKRMDLLQWLSNNTYNMKGERNTHLDIRFLSQCSQGQNVQVYSSLQTLMKMHPLFDLTIAHILSLDPCALILLSRNVKQSTWHLRYRHRLLSTLTSNNMSFDSIGRVLFVDQSSHRKYARLLCSVDIALDPFPFGGGVTLCDAIAGSCQLPPHRRQKVCSYEDLVARESRCEVPFITAGELQSVHRIGAGLVKKVNDSRLAVDVTCSDLKNAPDYLHRCVERYARLAVDVARKANERRREERREVEMSKEPARWIYRDNEVIEEWKQFLLIAAL